MSRFLSIAAGAVITLCAGCGGANTETTPTAATTPTVDLAEIAEIALGSAVDLRMTGCRALPVRGAGSMIEGIDGRRYIVTAAHVVAGADKISARPASASSAEVDAVLVAIDPVNDLALLSTSLDLGRLVPATLNDGDQGVVVVFREEVAEVRPFTIVNRAIVNIRDIYDQSKISRNGYRVQVEISPGDSGAVLVGPGGAAGGVLYAKTRGVDDNAFATNTEPFAALIESASTVDPVVGIDAGACP